MGNLISHPIVEHILTGVQAYLDEEEANLERDDEHRTRARNVHRDRGFALNRVNELSDKEFAEMFRMNRTGFAKLLELVSPFMHDTNQHMAEISSGSVISKSTKLYVTLRFLAGGSFHDLCFAWGIHKSTLFSTDPAKGVIWPTMEAIDECFSIGLPVDNTEELDKMAREFAVASHGEMHGCVTAIDGWVAKCRKPTRSEVTDIMAYRNRHDCWGLVVLAGCDAHCRFTMFSTMNSGSTNDTIAWDLSLLKKIIIDEGRLPNRYYIIGDEAFSCSNQLLVPYSGRGLGPWKDSFNYHLSAMRQCIERAFALLVQRWGILWRPLRSDFLTFNTSSMR